MGAPGCWEDQEQAARTSAEHARASRKLSVFRDLEHDVDDLEPLAEMAEEDPGLADGLAEVAHDPARGDVTHDDAGELHDQARLVQGRVGPGQRPLGEARRGALTDRAHGLTWRSW